MRSTVVYALMVGTPLLGLFGILEAGKRIVPPRSVGGDWALAAWGSGDPVCVTSDDGAATLRIVQSGTRAELLVAAGDERIHLDATVAGDSLFARADEDTRGTCAHATLRARIEDSGPTAWMMVTLVAGRCPDCRVERFVATRRTSASRPR